MRNLSFFSVLTLLFLLSSFSTALTQKYKTNDDLIWGSVNYGSAYNSFNGKNFRGTSFGMALNVNRGIHLFTLYGASSNTKHGPSLGDVIVGTIFTSLLGGTYQEPPSVYSKSKELGIMYGIISKPKVIRFYASTGISSVFGNGITNDNYIGIGIPLKAGFLLTSKYFGMGLSYQANYNSFSNFHGIALTVHLGRMR